MSLRERTRPSLSNRIVSPTKELLNHQFACGYAAPAPLYNYAAPAYAAPAAPGTTVIIVNPAPAYSAPVVGSGYYNYVPGYLGRGYGRAGYWGGGYGYGWR